MKLHKLKSAFSPLPITIALIVIFSVASSFSVIQAVPQPNYNGGAGGGAGGAGGGAAGGADDKSNLVCEFEMGKFLDVEFRKYMEFMNTHFQSKSSTASLLDTAFEKYKEFRTTAMNEYAKFKPHQGASILTEGLQPAACMAVVEKKLEDARRTLKTVATQTSAVKETTALITKYQDINAKLKVLNQSFLTMKSYITTFSDKLPCYARQGCTKG